MLIAVVSCQRQNDSISAHLNTPFGQSTPKRIDLGNGVLGGGNERQLKNVSVSTEHPETSNIPNQLG